MDTSISSLENNENRRFLKLTRYKSMIDPEVNVYDLDTWSLCKLVDGLSQGNFIQYSACKLENGDVVVDHKKTFKCFSYFLSETLDEKYTHNLFGDIYLHYPEDYDLYFAYNACINQEDCDAIIKKFILYKYDITPDKEYKFTRKENSLYKNY